MNAIWLVFRRELAAYFATPIAAVFLAVFLAGVAGMTFFVANFFDRGQADLSAFFLWHPWLFLVLMPAIGMRLWAEDRRTGTIELLLTLPFSVRDLVLGKFLAAWAFACVALALTVPLWITVAWLGSPDHGTILVGYIASALMAGTFLAIGAFLSAFTKNQVIAFVLSGVACFLLMVIGFPMLLDFVSGWLPRTAVEAIAAMSVLTHFESMMR